MSLKSQTSQKPEERTCSASQQAEIETIRRVALRYADKFTFGMYDVDDIVQQCYYWWYTKLRYKYDNSKPLENFLAVALKNELKNLWRNKYYRKDRLCEACLDAGQPTCKVCTGRQKLNSKKRSLAESVTVEHHTYGEYVDNSAVLVKEAKEKINSALPVEMRFDYLKMLDGVKVSSDRRIEIEEKIREILSIDEEPA